MFFDEKRGVIRNGIFRFVGSTDPTETSIYFNRAKAFSLLGQQLKAVNEYHHVIKINQKILKAISIWQTL